MATEFIVMDNCVFRVTDIKLIELKDPVIKVYLDTPNLEMYFRGAYASALLNLIDDTGYINSEWEKIKEKTYKAKPA